MGYASPVPRFVFFSITLLLLTIALFSFALDVAGLEPQATDLAFGPTSQHLPGHLLLATWLLEAIGLTALFLLIQGRGSNRLLDGLAAGWIAWVFRGPLLVLTVVSAANLPRQPWWRMTSRWLLLYTVCGLVLALLSRRLDLRRES